jgi:alkanesulfonate monooxygenase SsuD/methylene tetrahydromethanopterin reductase-like flavin-dependent oxidoreductase (luciferase family)
MELVLINDMRAPAFGAPRSDLFDATLDMATWADALGFDVLGLGEHHNSDDGYNPSPLILASALAARTKQIRLRSAILLASCYDPVRLAEDIAVLQILSHGRYELGLGFGYRRVEFAMYGRTFEGRFDHAIKVLQTLKKAWSGAEFDYDGRPCQIKPIPPQKVPVMLGGVAPKVARKAAEVADGLLVPMFGDESWTIYRQECVKLGHRDPGDYPKQGPAFLWISENPDKDWEWITPHLLHVLRSYSAWAQAENTASPYSVEDLTPEGVRRNPAYQVLTPDQAIGLIGQLGDNSSLYLAPLFAGIDPKKGWEMLRLYEREVHPHIPRGIRPTWRHR